MSKNTYPIETVINCCSKYRSGESVSNIVQEYHVPKSTVYYWINKYKNIPDVYDITLKKTLDNVRRKYEKSNKSVRC